MSTYMRCTDSLRLMIAVGCILTGFGNSSLSAQERTALNDDGHIVDFQRDIVPIFQKHCLECHNESEAKGDFRIDDPETVLGYVEPEDVEASTMFFDYMLSDDPDLLMPPPSKGGPLSAQELATVRVWIEEGAEWPDGVTIGATEAGEEPAAEQPQAAAPKTLLDRVWAFQGYLHPATVHFPVALFLFGALFVVLGWKWPAVGQQIPLACLVGGALTAIVATMMGWSFATEEGYGSWTKVDTDSEIFWHRWSGVIVAVTSSVLAIIALRAVKSADPKSDRIWKVGLLVVAGMVGAVGHQGGEMTYGKEFYPKAFQILLGTDGQEQAADASAEETPAEDTPAEDTPAEDAPVAGLPVDGTAAG